MAVTNPVIQNQKDKIIIDTVSRNGYALLGQLNQLVNQCLSFSTKDELAKKAIREVGNRFSKVQLEMLAAAVFAGDVSTAADDVELEELIKNGNQ